MPLFDRNKLKTLQSVENKTEYCVLIVDDEPHNLQVMNGILKNIYHVLTANNGEEALELIKGSASSRNIDLIISDQRMPGMNGIELLEKSLALTPNTIRIILTGFSDVKIILDAINHAHIYKFILKPFERDDLLLTIQRALESYELAQQNRKLIGALKSMNAQLELKVDEKTHDLREALERQTQLKNLSMTQKQALQKANERLTYLATRDDLTSLYNRRHFMEQGEQELKRATRYHRATSFLMLDIDHFKKVNDQYGHAAGDDALRTLAVLMRNSLRDSDICGRLGGEEFAILLPETDGVAAQELAERLRLDIAAMLIETSDKSFSITISIGVVAVTADECALETALQRADEALYHSKNTGRNRVSVWSATHEST